jgi:hypothetical protein
LPYAKAVEAETNETIAAAVTAESLGAAYDHRSGGKRPGKSQAEGKTPTFAQDGKTRRTKIMGARGLTESLIAAGTLRVPQQNRRRPKT